MAPKNKRKKPASNPARGFATTSVASKKNDPEVQDQKSQLLLNEDLSQPSSGRESVQPKPVASESQQKPERELHELSPEELEAHLEEADLQNFLEKYGEKIKREASRQVSRLRTEKRLLRMHSDTLSTRHWLPEEVLQLVLDHANVMRPVSSHIPRYPSVILPEELSDDDLVLFLWQLHLMLPQLQFSREDSLEAIIYVIQRHSGDRVSPLPTSKDGVWGLNLCMEWFARRTKGQKRSNYDLSHTELSVATSEERVRKDEQVTDTDEDSQEKGNSAKALEGSIKETSEDDEAVSEVTDLDSDMEPEHLVDKYLDLQQRLYRIDPQLVAPGKGMGKKGKGVNKVQAQNASLKSNSKIRKLQAQVTSVTSDVLFNEQRAHMLWDADLVQLCQEDAAKRRLENDGDLDAKAKASSTGTPLQEDSDLAVGNLFGSLPGLETEQRQGQISQSTEEAAGKHIEIRNFGSWNGVAPRRVLEDTCKARDASAKVVLNVVSQTTFSYRHAVTVFWSKPQDQVISAPFDSIDTSKSNAHQARIEMVGVACPNRNQSEAFAATVALFSIFAQFPKEEKASLRLPSVWREFWVEMSKRKAEQDDASDRQTLRMLRQLMKEIKSDDGDSSHMHSFSNYQGGNEEAGPERLIPNSTGSLPGDLKATWSTKVASDRFQTMLNSRMNLPIWNYRQDILQAIESNQVVIVCGATGCGKSTQVPAFILEHELSSGRACKIYCSEPRRISAISLARRVSDELGERKSDVGTSRSLVGFAVRLDSQMTTQTRLVYATTGIIMRMLEASEELEGISHLLLDEVHERSIESDFLLIVLRKLLVRRPSLRVVLMSATVDADKFSRYLGSAPIFEVPGRTFPVETQYLEDAIELTRFKLSETQGAGIDDDADEEGEDGSEVTKESALAKTSSQYSSQTQKTLAQLNEYRIPFDLIVRLLETVLSGRFSEYNKATLVFLPGIAEIRRLHDILVSHPSFRQRCEVFALHSSIATEEQERAFLVPPHGVRKIVLATNIAETGITIPDITCVIDTGKHKEMRFDERRQLSRLIEAFVSQANAIQRRGRAGRVQKGLCFHLFSRQRFEKMAKEQTPEIVRLSLQDLVLRVKICKMGDIAGTLSEALDPPSAKNIRRAIDALQDVKALTQSQDLTSLGGQLAQLPVDVFLGKLLLLGTVFGCLDASLTIAAIFSAKSPFNSSFGSKVQADQARLSFKRGDSDLLTAYNAFSAWRRVCQTTGASEQQFCQKHFLSIPTLQNIEDLKGQLANSLRDGGLLMLSPEEKAKVARGRPSFGRRTFVEIPDRYDINGNNDVILNTVIAMSFHPKLLKREGRAWRNIANNQSMVLHPTSVNKHFDNPPKWVSFYHVMQAANKNYNAHETSAVENIAVALFCGDAEFKMHAGVIVIDGNRVKFSVKDRTTMLALKTLRNGIKALIDNQVRHPGKGLNERDQQMMDMFQRIFSKDDKRSA